MNVLLLGLGRFGQTVLDGLAPGGRRRDGFHPLPWAADGSFAEGELKRRILDLLEPVEAYQRREPFSIQLIADLGEPGPALHILDCGRLVRILERDNLLFIRHDRTPGQVAAFITFSERLGQTDEYGELEVQAAAHFLSSASSAEDFPFDRCYLHMTPGGPTMVGMQSSEVFRERILLEANFIPAPHLRNILVQAQSRREECKGIFSSFSFIQVPRLSELERFHVRYSFEDLALGLGLDPPLQPSIRTALQEEWLATMDLPRGQEDRFPTERMAGLIARQTLTQSVASPEEMRQALHENEATLIRLIEAEFIDIKSKIQEGIDLLFQVPRLYGAFATYLDFLKVLQEKLLSWRKSKGSTTTPDAATLDALLESVRRRLDLVEKSRVLNLPSFRTIKEEAKSLALRSRGIRKYLEDSAFAQLDRKLAEFLDPSLNLHSAHPLIEEAISDLSRFIQNLKEEKARSSRRLEVLEGLIQAYYVRAPLDSVRFGKLLERLTAKVFPESKRSDLWDSYRNEVYAQWKREFGLGRQFLNREDSFAEHITAAARRLHDSPSISAALETSGLGEEEFHTRLANELSADLDQLIRRTFRPANDTSMLRSFLLFVPDSHLQDSLSEATATWVRQGAEQIPIKREASLGSVIAIKEWHFLPLADLALWATISSKLPDNAAELARDVFSEGVTESPSGRSQSEVAAISNSAGLADGSGSASEPAVSLSERKLYLLSNLLGGLVERGRLESLWSRHMGALPFKGLDEASLRDLADKMGIRAVLEELGEDDLRKLAHDINVLGGSNKEQSVELLSRKIGME